MNEASASAFAPHGRQSLVEPSFSILFPNQNIAPAEPQNPAARPTLHHKSLFSTSVETFQSLAQKIAALSAQPSPSQLVTEDKNKPRTLDEELFEATASAKILTSQVAMHLDAAWRQKIFDQLDSLHDVGEWEKGDSPLQRESFSTFLKAIFLLRPAIRPGLGLSMRGYLVAAWTNGENRLTIEFLPRDKVRWVATVSIDGEFEHTASEMPLSMLRSRLEAYAEEGWIGK